MDKPLPDDFNPYEVPHDMNPERVSEAAAGLATAGSWTLWGISLAQVNQVLQAIAFISAIACSWAAFAYYRRNK